MFIVLIRCTVLCILVAGCQDQISNQNMTEDELVQEGSINAGNVDDNRIIRASFEEPGSWLTYGQTYKEERFSHLTQINPNTVSRLGLAWAKTIGEMERMQATPLVVDGIMYVNNGTSVVYALDATTGNEVWSFDPRTDRSFSRYAFDLPTNRGVAVYKGRVYIATFDGRLIAIDAQNGKQIWDIDTWDPRGGGRFNITGAPRVAKDKIFIGQGSGESGKRRGYVTAYNAETGEIDWRFFLVPGNPNEPFEHPEMEMAAKTWGGEWWKLGGGGTAWNTLFYDEELNILYIGVGNGAPWPRTIRSPGGGDDLFLTAIVSVDVDTGRMNWYYQTSPGDNWDYTATQDITLSEMEVDGVMRKVLLQAPKNGFFYVIDRITGELLRAHPYTDGITWATHVDMNTGRPVENPDAYYDDNPQWILPANAGAHNWEPQSWDEDKGIMYFYYHDYPNFYSLDESFVKTGVYKQRETGLSLGIGFGEYRRNLEAKAGPRPETKGFITAFDPLTGEHIWRHELDVAFTGGVLATQSGILFHPEGNGRFTVRSTLDGSPIWHFDTYGRFSSSIMNYMIDGTQYVGTIVSGNQARGLKGTVLVFKIDGTHELASTAVSNLEIPIQPELDVSEAEITMGDTLYHSHCASCHRGIREASIVLTATPDLRNMTLETPASFDALVLGGERIEQGMPTFEGTLDADKTRQIRAFLIQEANAIRALQSDDRKQENDSISDRETG